MKPKTKLMITVACLGAIAFAWLCPASSPQKKQSHRVGGVVNTFKPFPAISK
jgi:hypothetical protein